MPQGKANHTPKRTRFLDRLKQNTQLSNGKTQAQSAAEEDINIAPSTASKWAHEYSEISEEAYRRPKRPGRGRLALHNIETLNMLVQDSNPIRDQYLEY